MGLPLWGATLRSNAQVVRRGQLQRTGQNLWMHGENAYTAGNIHFHVAGGAHSVHRAMIIIQCMSSHINIGVCMSDSWYVYEHDSQQPTIAHDSTSVNTVSYYVMTNLRGLAPWDLSHHMLQAQTKQAHMGIDVKV